MLAKVGRRLRLGQDLPVILTYHLVVRLEQDPWGLFVWPIFFAQQMFVLRQTQTPLPMDEFAARLMAGTPPGNAVAVIFNEGYRDNLAAAAPLLATPNITASVFVATGAPL